MIVVNINKQKQLFWNRAKNWLIPLLIILIVTIMVARNDTFSSARRWLQLRLSRLSATAVIPPELELDGSGQNVDSIAFWEAPNSEDTLMFVTAKQNSLVEVWQFPFIEREQSPLTHASFGSSQVNGVVVDQENNLLFVSVASPAATVSVFFLPELVFSHSFINGQADLGAEM